VEKLSSAAAVVSLAEAVAEVVADREEKAALAGSNKENIFSCENLCLVVMGNL